MRTITIVNSNVDRMKKGSNRRVEQTATFTAGEKGVNAENRKIGMLKISKKRQSTSLYMTKNSSEWLTISDGRTNGLAVARGHVALNLRTLGHGKRRFFNLTPRDDDVIMTSP